MLPFNLAVPVVTYSCFIVPLAITTYIPRDPQCYLNPGGTYYRVAITAIFTTFCVQVGTEICTFLFALRGTPLQTRKRWPAEYLLLLTYIVNLVQFGATIFGSWTLSEYVGLPCREDKALKPLVISSWILLALSLLWTLLCLKWFPNQQDSVETWVKRLRCVCYLCSCLGFQSALEPLRRMDMEDETAEATQREDALVKHLAETFSVIFGDVSFTASDRHTALVLATALQQKRRHERIRACLVDGKDIKKPEDVPHEEKQLSKALRHSITHKFPSIVCPSRFSLKVRPDLDAQEAADQYTGFSDRVSQEDLEEALGYFEYAVAAYYVQDHGLTAADGTEDAEGTEPSVRKGTAGGSKRQAAEPGSAADKPSGDDPPPKNEELADQSPPTFQEDPGPHTQEPLDDASLASGRSHAGAGHSGSASNPVLGLSPISETSENPDPSPTPRGAAESERRASSHQSHPQSDTAAVESSRSSGQSEVGGAERRGAQSNQQSLQGLGTPDGGGAKPPAGNDTGDSLRPTAGVSSQEGSEKGGTPQAGSKPERDAEGNSVTRLDVKDGSAEEQPSTLAAIGGSVSDTVAGMAEAISSSVEGMSHSVAAAVGLRGSGGTGPGGDEESGEAHRRESGRGMAGMAESFEGIDKTAKKAMEGDLQKGSKHHGHRSSDIDAAGRKVIDEDGDDQVAPGRCGICRSSLPTMTPLDKLDCIYSRADNTILGTLPYMIALDWERRAVVLGVRGTSSMSDALTDAIAQPIPILPWLGELVTEPDGEIAAVHSGILASAAALNHDLEDHGILSALLTGAAVDDRAKAQHTAAQPAAQQADAAAAIAALATPPETATPPEHQPAENSPERTALPASHALERSSQPADGQGAHMGSLAGVGAGQSTTSAAPTAAERTDAGKRAAQAHGGQRAVGSSPFAHSSLQLESITVAPEKLPNGGTAAKQEGAKGPRSAQELMARDAEVIQQCREMQKSEKERNEEAQRAREQRRRSPPRRPAKARWAQDAVGMDKRSASLGAEAWRSKSVRRFVRPSNDAVLHEDGGRQQSQRVEGSSLADARALEEGRRSQSLPQQTVGSASSAPHELPSQQVPQVQAAPPDSRRSLAGSFRRPDRNRDGERPDRRGSQDRQRSGRLPESIGGAGRMMKRLYSDAKNAFRDQEGSPSGSPKRRGRQQEAGDTRRDRLEEYMRAIEQQMKTRFLAKIFKQEEDLRKLEAAAQVEEQQQLRAQFRAQQLKQLEARKLDCRGWKLVLTGHSLGAGVAALLALKLRPRFPTVPIKCWAFCPPGGLVTPGLSHAMEPFCTSVVIGKDGVPRASLGNLSRLVDEVVAALARGRRCKARVLLRNMTARGRAKFRRPGEWYEVDQLPAQCQETLDLYVEGAVKRAEAIGQPVIPPGRVIYCRRLKEGKTQSSYDSVWIPPEALMKEGFLVSSKMLKDHLCDSVTTALEVSIERLKEKVSRSVRSSARVNHAPESSDEDTDSEE